MSTYSIATTAAISFILLTSFLITDFASASFPDGYYPLKATDEEIVHHNRKILMGLMGSQKAGGLEQEKPKYGVEMRNVPGGPDPLHHNNGPQKRPRISP